MAKQIEIRLIKLEQCIKQRSAEASPTVKRAVLVFNSFLETIDEAREWARETCTSEQVAAFDVWLNAGKFIEEEVTAFDGISLPDHIKGDLVFFYKQFDAFGEVVQMAAMDRWEKVGPESLIG